MVAGPSPQPALATVEDQSNVIPTHSRKMARNVLKGNRGGASRALGVIEPASEKRHLVECCAPYRHQHAEFWFRCRNSKCSGVLSHLHIRQGSGTDSG